MPFGISKNKYDYKHAFILSNHHLFNILRYQKLLLYLADRTEYRVHYLSQITLLIVDNSFELQHTIINWEIPLAYTLLFVSVPTGLNYERLACPRATEEDPRKRLFLSHSDGFPDYSVHQRPSLRGQSAHPVPIKRESGFNFLSAFLRSNFRSEESVLLSFACRSDMRRSEIACSFRRFFYFFPRMQAHNVSQRSSCCSAWLAAWVYVHNDDNCWTRKSMIMLFHRRQVH